MHRQETVPTVKVARRDRAAHRNRAKIGREERAAVAVDRADTAPAVSHRNALRVRPAYLMQP